MIVSASYRTDIPAFYGEWFSNRLRAGYCTAVNPYNRKSYRVPLTPGEVDGFIFWTKDLSQFRPRLAEVRERGFPFVVQYSITAYPRALERRAARFERSVADMRFLAREYGPYAAVWRYDTILFTSLTPLEFHRENFRRLAGLLEGSTDEVVVSFAQMYAKTRRSLERAATEHGLTWEDPAENAKRSFLVELAAIARAKGMRLTVCGQRELLTPGIDDASCVDAGRLSEVAGRRLEVKGGSHREGCGCHASRDIGAYDTCPYGCVYCYAVGSRETAVRRHRGHDPEGESLVAPS